MHEASMHTHNSFVTLTYNKENLPEYGTLVKADHQKFLKRLRKALSKEDDATASPYLRTHHVHADMGESPIPPLRGYYMAGEYGELLLRPHYHFCLFGIDFRDIKYLKTTKAGSKIYRSPELERLWPFGFSTVGKLTYESAAYTARYVMKKINGKKQEQHYEKIDTETGEIYSIIPEYNEMSRATGIGKTWIKTYTADVYDALPGKVILKGKAKNSPRYYNKYLEEIDPEKYEIIMELRKEEGRKYSDGHNTQKRLNVREQVTTAKLKALKRSI
jgi:hypothetical protein